MEFDELKKAWGQFNDKINCQEVVERQQVEEMLAKKRMTSYNRLLWYERISLGILFFLFLNVLVYILIDPFFLAMSDIVFFITISVHFGINLFQYYKLKQAGCMKYDLERQILHVLQYKSSLYWGYISTYVAFVPFLAWFIIYATLVRGCIIVGIVLLLVILDIFVFRHLYRKVGQLLEANKELRRLEDMIQNN